MRVGGWNVLGLAGVCLAGCAPGVASQRAHGGAADLASIEPDLGRIEDNKAWAVINGEVSASVEGGKSVVRLYPKGGNRKGSNSALALVQGLEFTEGTVEVDLKGRGAEQASFLGVAFAAADGTTYEAVYFRPFNFRVDDAEHRAHAVEYIAWPEHTWEKLRAETPGVYESAVDPVPDPAGWFHARIDIGKRKVSVFVNGASKPCLVVDRLGGAEGHDSGHSHDNKGVGLWVDSQEGWFQNLRIRPLPPPT